MSYPAPPAPVYRTDRNGMGTAALVLGILGTLFAFTLIFIPLAWILGILGLIFGIVGLARANRGEASNKRVALWGIITSSVAIFLGILFIVGFGVSLGNSKPTTSVPTISAPAAAPAAAVAPPVQNGPATTFGDGTWVVGSEIVPGTYRSTGAREGIFEFCSVFTYATDTADGEVLAVDSANANEPIRIKVSGKVKSVKASGCEPFTKV